MIGSQSGRDHSVSHFASPNHTHDDHPCWLAICAPDITRLAGCKRSDPSKNPRKSIPIERVAKRFPFRPGGGGGEGKNGSAAAYSPVQVHVVVRPACFRTPCRETEDRGIQYVCFSIRGPIHRPHMMLSVADVRRSGTGCRDTGECAHRVGPYASARRIGL